MLAVFKMDIEPVGHHVRIYINITYSATLPGHGTLLKILFGLCQPMEYTATACPSLCQLVILDQRAKLKKPDTIIYISYTVRALQDFSCPRQYRFRLFQNICIQVFRFCLSVYLTPCKISSSHYLSRNNMVLYPGRLFLVDFSNSNLIL